MQIREVQRNDLTPLLELYTQLHSNSIPEPSDNLEKLWEEILLDRNHHVIVGTVGNRLICSCVIVIVPNLTHGQRPYALIENVVTHKDYRNLGYATAVLNYARDIALKENCYKIMLMTSSKEDAVLRFYKKSGYNRQDKTAFIHWL